MWLSNVSPGIARLRSERGESPTRIYTPQRHSTHARLQMPRNSSGATFPFSQLAAVVSVLCRITSMHSYDDIKNLLEQRMHDAAERHQQESVNRRHTLEQFMRAHEVYEAFVLHGIIPEELSEDVDG